VFREVGKEGNQLVMERELKGGVKQGQTTTLTKPHNMLLKKATKGKVGGQALKRKGGWGRIRLSN